MEEIIKVLNYQPADMLDSDIENPVSGISHFFVNHPLHESRAKLWEFYQGWMHLASESPDGDELKDMLFFYNRLIEMMNLCYVFTQKNKEV
ncbi:hypothetical protein [Pedobacter jejuensis]|uniref:Uncharacterized protein n=1 Tax=Pedobacter jejuensis TaxID=1268550 RepID=A0A3N0BTU9_9SPHI|nr:hypothetical protein [Pedobacter jejuensis]RNL52491.1 hypothetical protein D7004_13155 [Pedobacter jejuensis]